MNEINWNQFMLKNSNPQEAFETMCRNIFLRKYKVYSHDFSANYNQTGLEIEPIKFEGKLYGFQCKFSSSGNSASFYAQLLSSLNKAVVAYPELDTVVVYTNLDIKPNVSVKDLLKPKKSDRVKISELCKKNSVEILWFTKHNFESALNEVDNYDLYRSFFSPQDTLGFLRDTLTNDERTFLSSNQFVDLPVRGKRFSGLQDDIMLQTFSIITGAAGTGKSEILKKLYLQCEIEYLQNISSEKSDANLPIPVFIRLRECVNGNLEELLRNRLKDYDASLADERNQYIFFFDGIDEVNSLNFGSVISCLANLHKKGLAKSFVLTSRNNSTNLTTALRTFTMEVYSIDPLTRCDVDEYFSQLNSVEQKDKLQRIKDSNPSLLEDITDIFSAVLLSDNLLGIDSTSTKVDLIKLNTQKLIENNQKYSLINLPEPKASAFEIIMSKISEKMQKSCNISVSRSDLQEVILTQFPNCSYLQIDEIIDYIAEIFFDSSSMDISQRRYSYRHKRYFEFYLYCYIKKQFYDNPAILRELRLLSNKDFILNIFLVQELKDNTLRANVQRVLALRFLEAYLGKEYLRGTKAPYLMPETLLISGADSYLQSNQLREYLCTKQYDDFCDFLKNDPLSVSGFLTVDNYYSFIKQYHIANDVDIRESLNQIYDIDYEWLKKAFGKDPTSYFYCKCVIENIPITDIYSEIISEAEYDIRTIDLDYYPYAGSCPVEIVGFFELAIEYFREWLTSIIDSISIQHLEIISYLLLQPQHINCITKRENSLSPLAIAICDRVTSFDTEQFRIHTIVLYGVLTGTIIQNSDIEKRAEKVNINHYGTWGNNFTLNSYVGMVLGEKFIPYHYDFRLGIELRRIVHEYYPCRKEGMLSAFLSEVNKYNLIHKNWFSYKNSVFIGEVLASLDINSANIKRFIIDLRKFDSVVSVFHILYVIMKRNPELYRIIANPSLIASEYSKTCRKPSYYDDNSNLAFMYATMISHFDIVKADALFENALNNSIFRPVFRKEDILDYYLPQCLLTAYENYWFSNEEFDLFVLRLNGILKTARHTLDSGAYGEYYNYVVKQCCPHLSETIHLSSERADKPERNMGWASYSNIVPTESITLDNLPQYYKCEIEGVNYSSVIVWKSLIEFELTYDIELSLLYKTLEDNYFPKSGFSKIGQCFHIITTVLLSNQNTIHKARDFIMKYGGRTGLANLLNAFALIGDDQSGRQCLEQLMRLCEALVYSASEKRERNNEYNRRNEKALDAVCNSKTDDWYRDDEKGIMHYIPDPKISIRWNPDDDRERCYSEWATKHPKKEAYFDQYRVYYAEEIIKICNLVWIDGFRALLPMPDPSTQHIDRQSYFVARLLNYDMDNLNGYIARSELIVD